MKRDNTILVHIPEEVMNEIRELSKELDYSLSRYGLRALKHQVQTDKKNRFVETDGGNDGEE